jgi:Trk K+ transport system NAD-binding subunit
MSSFAAMRGHVVVCGSDGLAVRVVEELRALEEDVVLIVPDESCRPFRRSRDWDIQTLVGDFQEDDVLKAAGIAEARAIALLEDHDVGNLHAALATQDLAAEDIDLVVRIFNSELGASFEPLIPHARFLSASVLAAPAFADAALHGHTGQRFELLGHAVEVREARPGDPGFVASLEEPANGSPGLALVEGQPERDAMRPITAARRRRRVRRGLGVLLDRRLGILLGVLATLIAISAIVFSGFYELSPVDAVYFTVTTVTTTGYGDINLLDASAALKVYGVCVMVLGALTIAVLYALVTDAIVGARLARELGQPPRPKRDHVIVCGLGTVGLRVVERLTAQGVECVAIDRDDERFGDAARRLGAPVIEGDAANAATLRSLHVDTACAVLAVTDNDVANLETAVAARAIRPDVRIVARLFDPDLADRVQRALSINISRSVATLAAPAFVAALYERRTLAVIPVGTRALVVAGVNVPGDSPLVGTPLGEVVSRYDGHVLATGDVWRPSPDAAVAPGELVVLASRRGVAEIEQAIRA